MATFQNIQDRVTRRVIDLPASVLTEIPTLINEAMRDLQTEHNFKVMEALSATFTTTVNTNTLGSVPSDFKEYRGKPYLTTDKGEVHKLGIMSGMRQEALRVVGVSTDTDTDRPAFILEGEPSDVAGARVWEVHPLADGLSDYSDGEYRIRVPYWKFLPALSAGTDTNWFTVNAERWLTFHATSMAFGINWDEARASYWEAQAAKEFGKVLKRDKLYRLSSVDTLNFNLDVRGARIDNADRFWRT